jgi:DNA-binding CsgD family transcriptional regulator
MPVSVLIGREVEMAELRKFVGFGDIGSTLLVLEGDAGIGKTTLWTESVHEAQRANVATQVCRPSQGEVVFSFSAITDLLAGLDDEVLVALPVPQRHALEAAGLRRQGRRGSTSSHVVAAGFLSVLRILGSARSVLVGIDDLQWVDSDSWTVLDYSLRRITRQDNVRFLLSRRTDDETPANLFRSDAEQPARRIVLGPMSFGAIERLIVDQLGHPLRRHVARHVYEMSEGNPLFALELAAAVDTNRGLELFENAADLALTPTLISLLQDRLSRIDSDVESAVLAVAVAPVSREETVRAVLQSREGLDDALSAGLIVREGDRLRLSHPLLGSAIRARASVAERRELHLRPSRIADDQEQRARHMAQALSPPNSRVAEQLLEASSLATARGASIAAAELSELAWHFTTFNDGAVWIARLFRTIELLCRAGLDAHGAELLTSEIAHLDDEAAVARATWWFSRLQTDAPPLESLDEALLGADATTRAEILADKAFTAVVGNVENLPAAIQWVTEAAELARAARDIRLEVTCVTTMAWMNALLGQDVEELLSSVDSAAALTLSSHDHPDRVRALRALWRGELDTARSLVVQWENRARESDESWSEAIFILHRFEVEQRAGDWLEAQRALERFEKAALTFSDPARVAVNRCRAVLAAARGDTDALDVATTAVMNVGHDGSRWQQLEALRARGLGRLVSGEHVAAAKDLTTVADFVENAGIREPGAFPVGADLVEALVGARRLEAARSTLAHFESVAMEQAHPWALAAAARARGLVLTQEGRTTEAMENLQDAIERHGRLGHVFDLARSQLALGPLLRQARRIADAREILEAAANTFGRMGSTVLESRACHELARLGGRRKSVGLTPTEERVADQVTKGLSNQDIANNLFITVNTVEAHLTRIYRKLGIHSRAQLIHQRLAETRPAVASKREQS